MPVASEDEVRSVDFSVPTSLFGASPLQALAAARETAELWAQQTRMQDERRKEKCAAELAEARAALAAEREDNRQLRAAKAKLSELVEALRRAAPEPGPVRDGGLTPRGPSPLARVVASPGAASRPPELFRAAAAAAAAAPSPRPAPLMAVASPDNVFSRFRVAASPAAAAAVPSAAAPVGVRPNSLMEGPPGGGALAGRPVTPALQILHTRRYY